MGNIRKEIFRMRMRNIGAEIGECFVVRRFPFGFIDVMRFEN